MKLKYQFETMPMGEKYVAVAITEGNDTFNGMLRFNETGAYVFSLLQEEISYDELVNQLVEKYHEEKSTIEEYLSDFLPTLKNAGVLE